MTKDAGNDLDDPIWGFEKMAPIIKRTPRQTHYLITSGALPEGTVKKVGGRWVTTKRKLLAALIGEETAA